MVWVSCLAAASVVIVILFLFDPVQAPIFPVCPFYRLTELNCPGCGSLRALHQLLHGDVIAALRFNAFLILSLPLFAWFGARLAWHQFKGGPPLTIRPVWAWTYVSAWIAFSILRELPFRPFTALAP
jgi:hypothetical protein